MTYDELIPFLQSNHFYANKIIEQKKDKAVCVGLYINCPPIVSNDRLVRVREVMPEGFKAEYLSNKMEIYITKIANFTGSNKI